MNKDLEFSYNQKDQSFDYHLRPPTLNDFVGQNKIKKQLNILIEAAKQRNVSLDEMIKCILLVSGSYEYVLACLPSDKQLNPQAVAEIAQTSKLQFASKEAIEPTLGYRLGAIPPLLLKENIPIIFDNSIKQKQKVNISSGNPSAGLELKAEDLIKLINPLFGDISK